MLRRLTRWLFIATHGRELRELAALTEYHRSNVPPWSSSPHFAAGLIEALERLELPSAVFRVAGRFRTTERFGSARR